MVRRLLAFTRLLWRRRVLPIALVYAVVAAVLAPTALLLEARLRLPAWTDEAVLAGLLLLFVPAVWLAWSSEPTSRRAVAPVRRNSATIAVLPFVNLSQAAADEAFADGVVEDLITGLAMFSTLTVI